MLLDLHDRQSQACVIIGEVRLKVIGKIYRQVSTTKRGSCFYALGVLYIIRLSEQWIASSKKINVMSYKLNHLTAYISKPRDLFNFVKPLPDKILTDPEPAVHYNTSNDGEFYETCAFRQDKLQLLIGS